MPARCSVVYCLSAVCVFLSACASWAPFPATIPISDEARRLEKQVIALVNAHRRTHRLAPLIVHPNLQNEARRHSYAMAKRILPFGHRMFRQRMERIARTLPFSQASENVAYNQNEKDPARDILQGWLESPGHRRNIEGEYDLTGVGVFINENGVIYYTQIFLAY